MLLLSPSSFIMTLKLWAITVCRGRDEGFLERWWEVSGSELKQLICCCCRSCCCCYWRQRKAELGSNLVIHTVFADCKCLSRGSRKRKKQETKPTLFLLPSPTFFFFTSQKFGFRCFGHIIRYLWPSLKVGNLVGRSAAPAGVPAACRCDNDTPAGLRQRAREGRDSGSV